MTTIRFHSFVAGAVALLVVAANAAAAIAAAPGVLNVVEVRQLVARGDPGDHARLALHFAGLADRYAADATWHEAMANAAAGNPNRQVFSDKSHCRRLAELKAQSDATLRELAEHHDRLAAGVRSAEPPDSAAFEAGEGAPDPTAAELKALAANAHTPADHRGLEEYFLTLANRYTGEARDHGAMANAYRVSPRTRFEAVGHCDRLAKLARASVKEATDAAVLHRELARVAR